MRVISEKEFARSYSDPIDGMCEELLEKACTHCGIKYRKDGYDDGFIPDVRERVFEALKERGFNTEGDGREF